MKFWPLIILLSCSSLQNKKPTVSRGTFDTVKTTEWKPGETPRTTKSGFEVIKFAEELNNPVWAYETPGGDILIAEKDQITLLRDTNGDGKVEVRSVFLSNLQRPLGMVILGSWFYVATERELLRYPYTEGMTKIKGEGEQVLSLPREGRQGHWKRSLIASQDFSQLYLGVGSNSDHGEHGIEDEERRANVLRVDPNQKTEKVFSYGLRNPIGMDWQPHTGFLWVVVEEGNDSHAPEDYLTLIKQDLYYGWPYYHWGRKKDKRWSGKIPKKLPRVRVPHLKLGKGVGSTALIFYRGKAFGPHYRSGAFISQANSQKVIFVPFSKGVPSGRPEDFLVGFKIGKKHRQIKGRPTGLVELNRGELLVCDDLGGTVWIVRSKDAMGSY